MGCIRRFALLLFLLPLSAFLLAQDITLSLDQWTRIQTLLLDYGQTINASEDTLQNLIDSIQNASALSLNSALLVDDLNENTGTQGSILDASKEIIKNTEKSIKTLQTSSRRSTIKTVLMVLLISAAVGSLSFGVGFYVGTGIK